MKRSIIVGNWKMYATSISDAHILATTIRNSLSQAPEIEAILCPPAIWLPEVAAIIRKNDKLKIGAQNASNEPEGAYTGEISPLMIKEVADYVILGHSERREYFGETDIEVGEKARLALKAGLCPIICVGERKGKNNIKEPYNELKESLKQIPKTSLADIIVAYEPLWAIGTGENAEAKYVAQVCTKLRELLDQKTPILYGGSVNSKNIEDYAVRPEIDGVLVGGG